MNYYAARQRHDKKWDWTRMNDGDVWAHPPCQDMCGHATKAEAEKHFYDYQISKLEEVEAEDRTLHLCDAPGCKTLTNKGLRGIHYFTTPSWLCVQHRFPNVFEILHPFAEGIEVWASW